MQVLKIISNKRKEVKQMNFLKHLFSSEKEDSNIEEYKKEFLSEEKELLVLIRNGVTGAMIAGDYYKPAVGFLASVDVETGEVSYERGALNWMVKKNTRKRDYGYHFNALSIYRVRVRKCIEIELESYMSPLWNNRYFLLEVLKKNEFHPELDKIRNEYKKPVHIDNEFGHFVLNRECDLFEGRFNWLGVSCEIDLKVDKEGAVSMDQSMNNLLVMNKDLADWDRKVREFAATELVSTANDWNEDDEEEVNEITEEEFAKRLEIDSLKVYANGEIEVCFLDDDMFRGHWIVVKVNVLSGEFISADIEG